MIQYIKSISIISVLCLACSTGVMAQSLGKSVIAANGGSYTGPGMLVDWTMGQAVTHYATPASLIVTEGFHPVDAVYGPSTEQVKPVVNPLQVSAFPNPVSNLLHITIKQNAAEPIAIQVADVMGKMVKTMTLPAALNEETDIDMSQLASGTYYVLINEHTGNGQVMKVVKN